MSLLDRGGGAPRIAGLGLAGVASTDAPAVATFRDVDDVEVATREPAARGVEPDGELIAGDGLRYRHLRAPDGRVFELIDRRDQS